MEGKKQWRVLEFYSGVGGMRYSLARAGVDGEVVEAFDINDLANDVYQHNFGHRPYQGNIQSLTSADLDKYGADAWLLSPPCQPYTRQGLQKHSADARASSFINVMELLPQMKKPPSMLFVENVVGFETSDTHEHLMRIFAENCFAAQEFILSPLQFGVPYSRPRYFCLAKRKPFRFREPPFSGQLLQCPCPLGTHEIFGSVDKDCQLRTECKPIKCFLESSYACADHKEAAEDTPHDNSFDEYTVPSSLIERWGSAMDIVSPDSKRCCCFTKSYYRYVKGTGSLLANNIQPNDNPKDLTLKELGLRYFTPKEVANLHSFPEDFSFPSHVNLRQRYALLGNSLSVAVVAPLLEYLFS